MKADLRISIKDYHRSKTLKIQLSRLPYGGKRQFLVKMNGELWPKDDRPVSLTRLLTAMRKSLVKSCPGFELDTSTETFLAPKSFRKLRPWLGVKTA